MSKYTKLVSIVGLAAVLSPGVSYARRDIVPTGPAVQLIEIPGATTSTLRGRAAENATLQPTYTIVGPATEVAGTQINPSDSAGD